MSHATTDCNGVAIEHNESNAAFENMLDDTLPMLLAERVEFEDRYAATNGGDLPPGSMSRDGYRVARGEACLVL